MPTSLSPKFLNNILNYQHKNFTFALSITFVYTVKFLQPNRKIVIPGEFYHEIAAQILLVSLRQARRNQHFCILSRSDQDCILRHVWNELFLLHAAYWPIDVSALIRRANNNDHIRENGAKDATNSVITNSTSRLLRRSLELCQNLQLDAIELSLMETLILCRKGKIKGI